MKVMTDPWKSKKPTFDVSLIKGLVKPIEAKKLYLVHIMDGSIIIATTVFSKRSYAENVERILRAKSFKVVLEEK